MSLYGALFGENAASDVVLAAIGLTKNDVGRFRDAGVADGKIFVYTRNGGGNRDCWCAGSERFGTAKCKHRDETELVDEWVKMPEAEAKATGKPLGTTYVGDGVFRDVKTGRKVEVTRHVCLNPDTADCHCIGCFMTYHVHELPHYSHVRDDEFDSTYATIYFSFPPEYADDLKALDEGREWSPSDNWHKMIDSIKAATP